MAYNDPAVESESSLDLDLVRDFLMKNPSFVRADSELLYCIAKDPGSGNVISIEELARNRLLKDSKAARSRFAQIVEAARNNYESQIRVQEAIIAVLDSVDADDLKDRLSGHVAFALAADSCVIAISENNSQDKELDKVGSFVEHLVPREQPIFIGPVIGVRNWLYGNNAKCVQSEALVRVEFGKTRRLGLLAIGSSDASCFNEEMGQELVTFFARVVERVLTRLEKDGQL